MVWICQGNVLPLQWDTVKESMDTSGDRNEKLKNHIKLETKKIPPSLNPSLTESLTKFLTTMKMWLERVDLHYRSCTNATTYLP